MDNQEKARADLSPSPEVEKELVEALRTARDYVDDASRGILRYRGRSDISDMAGDDLVTIDEALAPFIKTGSAP